MSDGCAPAIALWGAASPIGGAVARRLGAQGMRLVLLDPDAEAGRALAAALAREGCASAFEPLDAEPPEGPAGLAERVARPFGAPAGLVGIFAPAGSGAFLALDGEVLDGAYRAGLRAGFALCRALAPGMLAAGGGSIVHVVPASALEPTTGTSAIAAIGAGLVGFTRALALELRAQRIRVNLVVARTAADDRAREVTPERAGSGAPPAPVEPADVAEAVAWLLDPRSAALVGGTLHVTGGEPMAR